MGGEFLFTIGAALGGVMFLYLLYRSWRASSRPYALPTLALSIGVGVWFSYGTPLRDYHVFFLVGFLVGAAVFSLHASAIKVLVEMRR